MATDLTSLVPNLFVKTGRKLTTEELEELLRVGVGAYNAAAACDARTARNRPVP